MDSSGLMTICQRTVKVSWQLCEGSGMLSSPVRSSSGQGPSRRIAQPPMLMSVTSPERATPGART